MAKIKKGVKKKLTILFFLVFILLAVVGIKMIFNGTSSFEHKTEEKKEDPIKVYKASLIATGDGLLHSPVYNAGRQSDGSYDFSHMLTYIKDVIKDYDIKYYNQETVSDSSRPLKSYPIFNTPTAFNQNMIDIGFNMVSLATNHSMDMGGDSAKKSAEWWEAKTEVLTHGMASSKEKRDEYDIKEVNGITYTMLSYTYGTNGMPVPKDSPWVINVFNEEEAKKDIDAVRDKVDILIVAMHWGNEYQLDASETQKKQAKWLAENGVDIVLGNHSHCVQPWEKIGDTIVFYSHGNFISNQMGATGYTNIQKVGVIGLLSSLDITKTVDTRDNTTTIKIDNIGAEFIYTYKYSNNGKFDYLVIPFSQMDEKYLNYYYKGKSLAKVYDEFAAVLKKYDDSIKIKPYKDMEEKTTTISETN